MALKIRLSRYGDKKSPFYRVVVAESSAPRDGKFVDIVGTYDPLKAEGGTNIDAEKATSWISKGATPTETAKSVLIKSGVIKAETKTKKVSAKTTAPKAKKKQK